MLPSKRCFWKGHLGREKQGKRIQENCFATQLAVLGFMVMGLASGCLWPIILTQSPSWWHTHCSAKMDVREKDSGSWLDTWCHLLTFPDLFQLVVAYQFHVPYGPLVVKQLMQMVTWLDSAWPGWVVSVSVLPLTVTLAKRIITVRWLEQGKGVQNDGG